MLAELGELEAANAEADAILEMLADDDPAHPPVALLVALYETLERGDALELHLAGDPGGAAELMQEIGMPAAAARWRLVAGKQLVAQGRHAEADGLLEQAHAFFCSVGAPRYVREAESLLSATA